MEKPGSGLLQLFCPGSRHTSLPSSLVEVQERKDLGGTNTNQSFNILSFYSLYQPVRFNPERLIL